MVMSSEFILNPPRRRSADLLRLLGWTIVLAFLVWSWRGAEMHPLTLLSESGNILPLVRDFCRQSTLARHTMAGREHLSLV